MSPTGIHLDEGASGPPPRVPRLTRACQVPSPQFIFYLLRFYLFTTPPLSKGSYLFIYSQHHPCPKWVNFFYSQYHLCSKRVIYLFIYLFIHNTTLSKASYLFINSFTTPPLSKVSFLFIILHVMLRATKARAQWVRMGVLQEVLIPETSIGCRNTQTETHTVYPSRCMVQFSTKDIRRGHVLVDDVHWGSTLSVVFKSFSLMYLQDISAKWNIMNSISPSMSIKVKKYAYICL